MLGMRGSDKAAFVSPTWVLLLLVVVVLLLLLLVVLLRRWLPLARSSMISWRGWVRPG